MFVSVTARSVLCFDRTHGAGKALLVTSQFERSSHIRTLEDLGRWVLDVQFILLIRAILAVLKLLKNTKRETCGMAAARVPFANAIQ